jgi:hypothetical protein
MALTRQALEQVGGIFVDFMKQRIQEKIYPYGWKGDPPTSRGLGDKVATGRLLNSLTYRVQDEGGQPVLVLTYVDYFKYVNLGRRPGVKRVPMKVLFDWIKIKKIRGRDKKGRFIKDMSLAWAIQTNIFKYGIRPANIYDKTLDSLEDLFDNPPPEIQAEIDDLVEAMAGDINTLIEQTIDDEIKTINDGS